MGAKDWLVNKLMRNILGTPMKDIDPALVNVNEQINKRLEGPNLRPQIRLDSIVSSRQEYLSGWNRMCATQTTCLFRAIN